MNSKTGLMHEVKESYNYDRFKLIIDINREVNPSHIENLTKSIKRMGYTGNIVCTYTDIIDGTKRLYILDGQHTFFALKNLRLPIRYCIIDVRDKKDLVEKMALYNSTSSVWKLVNYVEAWSALIDDYKVILKHYEEKNIPLSSLASLAMNKESRDVNNAIKKGQVRIINDKFEQLIRYVHDIFVVVQPRKNGFVKERLNIAFLQYFNSQEKYDHKKIIARLEQTRDQFIAIGNDQELIYEFLNQFIFID